MTDWTQLSSTHRRFGPLRYSRWYENGQHLERRWWLGRWTFSLPAHASGVVGFSERYGYQKAWHVLGGCLKHLPRSRGGVVNGRRADRGSVVSAVLVIVTLILLGVALLAAADAGEALRCRRLAGTAAAERYGCASMNFPAGVVGEVTPAGDTTGAATPRRSGVAASPRPTATRASRSEHRTQLLDVTCYIATGHRTASGAWPRPGMAAGNRWPFGTRLAVEGVGTVTVTDRIGHSSDLDLFMTDLHTCRAFGRQRLHVQETR